jgi:hypothetical protein
MMLGVAAGMSEIERMTIARGVTRSAGRFR